MTGTIILLLIIATFLVVYNWPAIKARAKAWFADESARIHTVTGGI